MFKKAITDVLRTPIKNLVLTIVLTVGCVIICLAIHFYRYIESNMSLAEKAFTTIAIPNTRHVYDPYNKNSFLYKKPNIPAIFGGEYPASKDFYLELRRFINDSPYARIIQQEILRGVAQGVSPPLTGAFNPLNYDVNGDAPCNYAAFIATVKDVEVTGTHIDNTNLFENDILNRMTLKNAYSGVAYIVTFNVDSTVVLNKSYTAPEIIYVADEIFTKEGEVPFKTGEQYLISGEYAQVRNIQVAEGKPPNDYLVFTADPQGVHSMVLTQPYSSLSFNDYPIIFNDTEVYVSTFTQDQHQTFYVPYTNNLDELYEKNPNIKVAIDKIDISANTITVHTVDNINNLLYFNQRKAQIVAGRAYTLDEAQEGQPVCIVGNNFAQFNGLNVGDFIEISLYTMSINNGLLREYQYEKQRGKLRLEIVGIYSAPAWDVIQSEHAPTDATIFMPFNSIPVKAEELQLPENVKDIEDIFEQFMFANYSTHDIPSLFIIEIENNKLQEFQEEVMEKGYFIDVLIHDGIDWVTVQEDLFIYSDMGYESLGDAVSVITDSSRLVLYISIGVFVTIVMFYVALFLLPRKRYEIGILISLGASKQHTIITSAISWLIPPFIAVMFGFTATIITTNDMIVLAVDMAVDNLRFKDVFSASKSVIDIVLSEFAFLTDTVKITAITSAAIFLLYIILTFATSVIISNMPLLRLVRRRE